MKIYILGKANIFGPTNNFFVQNLKKYIVGLVSWWIKASCDKITKQ